MMTGEGILFDLQRGNIVNIHTEIRAYIEPALDSSVRRKSSELATFSFHSVKFLHAFTTHFDRVPDAEVNDVWSVLHGCYRCSKLHQVALKEPLTVEKLLYHMMSKLLKRGFHEAGLQCATDIHNDITTKDVDALARSNMAYGAFVVLWNCTLQHEQTTANPDCLLIVKLRAMAIRLLLASDKALAMIEEKIAVTIEKLRFSLSRKSRSSNRNFVESTLEVASKMLSDVTEFLRINIGVEKGKEVFVMYTEVHLRHLRLLVDYGCLEDASAVAEKLKDDVASLSGSSKMLAKQRDFVDVSMALRCIGVAAASTTTRNAPIFGCNGSTSDLSNSVEACCKKLDALCRGQCFDVDLLRITTNSCYFCVDCLQRQQSSVDDHVVYMLNEHLVHLYGIESKLLLAALRKTQQQKEAAPQWRNRLTFVRRTEIEVCLRKLDRVLVGQLDEKGNDVHGDGLMRQSQDDITHVYKSLERYRETAECGTKEDDQAWINDLLSHLGNVAYKFGRLSYNGGSYTDAAAFLQTACLLASRQSGTSKSGSSDEQKQGRTWRKHELLANAQRRIGRFDVAMATIVDGLVMDWSSLAQAAYVWIRIKYDLSKVDAGSLLLVRTLCAAYLARATETESRDEQLLQAEQHALKASRISMFGVHVTLLDELLHVTNCPSEKAIVIIDKVQLLWAARRESASVMAKLCRTAIRLLDSCEPSPTCDDDRAMAHLWLYIVQDVDPSQLKDDQGKTVDGESENNRPATPTSDSEEQDSYEECCTVAMETKALGPAVRALELWEGLVGTEEGRGKLRPPDTTLDSLVILTAVFRLGDRTSYTLRVLRVMQTVAQRSGNHQHYMFACTQLIDNLLTCSQPPLAEEVVGATEEWMRSSPGVKSALDQSALYVHFLLAKSHVLLQLNRIDAGYDALIDADTVKSSIKSRSKDGLILECEMRRLQARYLGLPSHLAPSRHRDALQEWHVMGLMAKGTRCVTGLVCSLLGWWILYKNKTPENIVDSKVPSNVVDKWQTLDRVLSMLRDLGALCLQLGEARETILYLRQGMDVARAFGLPHRFAEFQLLRAKLDIVMGKFNDCNSHLHVLTYVMSDNKGEVKRRAPNTVSNTPTPKASIQVYEDTIVSEDEAEFLKSQPLNMPESLSLHHHGNGCASPVATTNRRRGDVPKSWLHSVRCNCVRCQDIASHALSLQLLAVQSDSCLQQGRISEAATFARILVRNHDNVAEKAQHVLRTSLAKLKNPVLPSMFEHVLLDGCVLMAQLQSDVDAAQEWLHRAHDLLDVRTRPRMVEAHAVLAQLHYQMALSAVPWPRYNGDVAETTVEKLCSQIGRITIAGDDGDGSRGDSGEFQTPLVTKLNLHSVDRSGDEITPENASTMDQGEGGQVDINMEESAGLDRVGFAPKKKRGRVVRDTVKPIDAQKLPFSAGGKSTSKVGQLPSRGAKIASIESVASCSEHHNVDLNSPKAEVRAPVRKTRAVRKCPTKHTDVVTNGCDKEVDNKPSTDDCSVTETDNSTPDHGQISDQVKVVTSDEKPISANSILATKTQKNMSVCQAKTQATTESEGSRERVARKGVSCSTQTSRASSRQAKPTVYVDAEGGVMDDPTDKPGRAGKTRTRCVRKTSAKTSARCSQSSEKDTYVEAKHSMVEEENIDSPEPCDSSVTVRGNRKGSKSKSTARKAAAVKTSNTRDAGEPVQSLFKESLTETNRTNDATVFDFECTTPVQERQRNAASHRKGRLTLKKKAGRPKTDVIEVEMARNAQEDVDPSYDESDVVLPEIETSPVVEQVKVVASSKRRPVRSKRAAPSRSRVTRSKTGFVEEKREQLDEDEEDVGALLGFDEVPLIEANDSLSDSCHDDGDEVACEQIIGGCENGKYSEFENGKLMRSTEFFAIQSCGVDALKIGQTLDVESIDHVDDIAMPDYDDNSAAQSSGVGFVSETLPLGAACLCLDDSIEIARFGSDSDTEQAPIRRRAGRRGNGRRVATETARASQGVDPVNLVTSIEGTLVKNHVATLPPCLPLTGGVERSQALLRTTFDLIRHHPQAILYRNVCQALAAHRMSCDVVAAAFYLAEAQAVTFRHQALTNIERKVRKQEKGMENGGDTIDALTMGVDSLRIGPAANKSTASLRQMKERLAFNKDESHVTEMIKAIPKDWTVCQVSLIGQASGQMVVTRFVNGQPPLIVHLPGFGTTHGQKVLQEFAEVMQRTRETMSVECKIEWWQKRFQLDEKLKGLLEEMESWWLGCWRGVLLGTPCSEADRTELSKATSAVAKEFGAPSKLKATKLHQQIEILLSSCHLLGDRELLSAVRQLAPLSDASKLERLIATIQRRAKQLNLGASSRQHMILILDRGIQAIPWESIPMVRGGSMTVSRIPSLHFLHAQLPLLEGDSEGTYRAGVDPRSAFYVVDPENNLMKTQDCFRDLFARQPGWHGIIGQPPMAGQCTEAVRDNDLFIYVGHGGGNKYLSGESLQASECRAVALLMGCSSGKLTTAGQLDAAGLMLNYFLGGCPCVVANLWDVTDRDIDRFLEFLLQTWLVDPTNGEHSLGGAVATCRDACRLPFLIGAAPVVYGFPIRSKDIAR